MLTHQRLEQELSVKLAQLPATKWQDVLDFVNFLVYQQTSRIKEPSVASGESTEPDPLEVFVGAVAHGALAQAIDEAVYSS